MEFSVTTRDTIKIVKPTGVINWDDARKFDEKVSALIESGCYHIAFIFDEVVTICSGVIGSIVYNLNKVKKKNGAFYLISSNQSINALFSDLKFDIVFEGYLFSSYDEFHKKIIEKK